MGANHVVKGLLARRLRVVSVVFLGAALCGGVAAPRSAAAAGSFVSTGVNAGSGLCLDDPNSQTTTGVQLNQLTCNGGSNQSWTFNPVSGAANTYNITSFAGLCVDISGRSTADNAQVIQWTCNGQTNQEFKPQAVSISGKSNTFNLVAVHSGKCIGPAGDSTASNTLLVQLPCTSAATRVWQLPGFSSGTSTGFQGLPNVAPNACNNSSLPKAYGTNFPAPSDPNGQGFANETAIGWDGNFWPVFEYLSGSFFARGVPTTYTSGGTAYCGGMYTFSAYDFGGAPGPNSVQWTEDSGYLPAMTTTRTVGSVTISIKDFADKVTISGNPFMLVYVRVAVTNNGSSAVSVPPGGSGPNLIQLTSSSLSTVQPGQTNNNDFVVAVDNFGTGVALPTGSALSANAPSLDSAYSAMTTHWNGRLAETASFQLPNLTLPNTNNLTNPGTNLTNAFKAGTIYTLIMQVGEAQFSAANNYAWILNHDVPGELQARFDSGDFHDAQNLLLTARISESPSFNEVGANWYWDGVWKTLGTWADYLRLTGDTAFVSQFFHDDASGSSPWGPSLFTIMRTLYPSQLASDGTLVSNDDNDSTGRWLFSNYSALEALAAYKYIATRIGQTSEAQWADGAYISLLNALNTVVGNNESANGFNYLPCTVDQPNSANRCGTFNDANWASPGWVGQNQWSTMLMGGTLTGLIGDPGQIDRMYQTGFARLAANNLPYPTFGAFTGYSTAYNTAYSNDGLYSNNYRDLPITSYAWQIQTTTGGPNAWWEANGSGPNSNNPWAGSHAPPEFGACPYAWPITGQQLSLLQSIAATGLSSSGTGPFTYTEPLYIGRGIPDTWIASGQTVAVSNLTSGYNISSGSRSTYGVSIAVTQASTRVVTVTISGTPPGGPVLIQLPIFLSTGVNSVTNGTYNATTHTVTATSGATQVTITLAS
ncbi:MAG: RICIN domain-containing protein [Streptosporangiaceae bacterium]|nr:RICIN domain-containing protein [Streptosporangiaceae bacterium]